MTNIYNRELKRHYYELDRDKKEVLIRDKATGEEVRLPKVNVFSTIRFLVSAAQKLTMRPRKKS